MVTALDEGADDSSYAGNDHPGRPVGLAHGGPVQPVIGPMVHPDTLWACTTCRACVQECPMMIEHVDAVIDLRRFQTLELGATSGKAAGVLEELKATDNPGGRPLSRRLDWAVDLSLPVLADKGRCDVLLWLGDGAFDLRTQRSLRALVRLLRRAGIDFAVLGDEELDCGDVARRLGDEATFQDLARAMSPRCADRVRPHRHRRSPCSPFPPERVPALRAATYPSSITRPSCGRFWKRRLTVNAAPVSDHSHRSRPRYLGLYNGEIDAPGPSWTPSASTVSRWSAPASVRAAAAAEVAPPWPTYRASAASPMSAWTTPATGAATVAVACPNCALMLEGVVGPRPQVAEIAELVLAATEAPK